MLKMVQRFLPLLALTVTFLSGIAPFSGYAQTPQYIFPGSNTSFTGGANSFPLNSTNTGSNMCQWLYLPSDFNVTPPTSGVFITAVYIKPTNSVTYTFTSPQIKLGNTTLTTLTSGTWNTGLTTAYNPATATLTTSANNWLQFTLTTPVFYSGGPLIFELTHNTAGASGITINQFSVTGRNGRMYGVASNASSSGADGATAVFGFDCIPAACSGTPTAPTITTAPFPAAAPLCAGSTTTITAANTNLGSGITFQWQTSASATGPWVNVTGGSGATTLSYTTGPVPSNTYFRMGVTCTNSNITTYSPAYLVPTGAPQPGTIQGPSTFCPGDTATYAVPMVPGSTYAWTLPAGWVGTSTTNSILVRPNGSPGTISVIATSPCGTSIAQSRAIVNGYAPSAAPAVLGNAYICAGSSQTYSVAPVSGATSYIWTLPAGWKGSLTPTTDTTNVPTITIPNVNNSGTISVRTRNGCGTSNATSLAVNVISSLASPGTITGKDTVCSGTLQTYSIAPVNGATSYVWTLPTGWSGTTSGTSVQVFGGTTTGSVTVTAYVSCATSPTSSKVITAVTTITPTVSLSQPPGVVCEGTPIQFTATATGGGANPTFTWRKNGTPVSATGSTYTTASLQNGDVISVTLTSNASCASTTTAAAVPLNIAVTPAVVPGISINTLPTTTICRGTSLNLSATMTGGGTGPKYQWYRNDTLIAGANSLSFTAVTPNNNDTFRVELKSDAVCATKTDVSSNKVGIVVADELVPTVSVSVSPSEIINLGDEVTFTATQSNGGATPDYQWMRNGVNIPFATGASYTTTTLQHNDHISVRMLSYLNCAMPKVAVSNSIVIRNGALSVGTAAAKRGFGLYPNPTSGTISLTGTTAVTGGLRVEILSAVGQIVHRVEMPAGGAIANWQHSIELPSSLVNGHYMLRVSTETDGSRQSIANLPFVLQH